MRCSGRCWAGSSGVGSGEKSLRLLAESLADRLAPELPAGLRLSVDDRGVLTISGESTRRDGVHAETEGGEIRLWFGLVPPGSPEGQWRNVLPELAPTPLSRLSG
jgi:hypothetical protein